MAKNFMLLYGKNSILERIKANPKSIRKIFVKDDAEFSELEILIKKNNIPLEHISLSALSKIRPAKDLQGIVARVDEFQYASFDELLSKPSSQRPLFIPNQEDSASDGNKSAVGIPLRKEQTSTDTAGVNPRSFIFLDRINDPQNLGVIIRTAACFGGLAIVIPRFESCPVTEAVLHVASGGENFVPVAVVNNLTNAIIAAKKCGYWILGGVLSDDSQDIHKIDLPFPLGLVLGFEGEGIRPGLIKQLDIKARIPMEGAKLSLNVAMACAIFCYEISRQRKGFK